FDADSNGSGQQATQSLVCRLTSLPSARNARRIFSVSITCIFERELRQSGAVTLSQRFQNVSKGTQIIGSLVVGLKGTARRRNALNDVKQQSLFRCIHRPPLRVPRKFVE